MGQSPTLAAILGCWVDMRRNPHRTPTQRATPVEKKAMALPGADLKP
jgi:hypothetical protein